ncbi:MAG: error-prone DNA polymerase [Planctomycetota bacterium]|nr:error-prone DNA polymerase [Planctomycetota bacterium]
MIHPFRREHGGSAPARARPAVRYVELAVTSNYSFLRGASHPEEMVEAASALGHAGAAIADRNTLAGVVRAHVMAKELGVPLAVGSRLALADPAGLELLAYPMTRGAYARLCRLLTLGKRRASKGECRLTLHDLLEHEEDTLLIVMPPAELTEEFAGVVRGLRGRIGDDRLSLGAVRRYGSDDEARLRELGRLGACADVPVVAVNDAHMHSPERQALQDALTCVRLGCTLRQAGYRLHANAERCMKSGEEMARLMRLLPGAVERTLEIHSRAVCFGLDQLKYEYPDEPCPPGVRPAAYLRYLCEQGAAERYPRGTPAKVRSSLDHELGLIEELGYEAYFLTCHDIVRFARSRGILCQGRGGAANSAVCYCLGITEVDPSRFSLLFERFVSRERKEPPDIDVDFEHERREEVIQYIYRRYGRDRAALTAEVITYRGRSAVRDIGRALGLSLDTVEVMARGLDLWSEAPCERRVREAGLNPEDPTIGMVMELCRQVRGFPRHLSQHVGGFVITRSALSELVPIENAAMQDRTVIEWDKDDIDALGMLKVDVLGLGMLTCVRKCFDLVNGWRGSGAGAGGGARPESLSISAVPHDDPAVYAMIQRADTVGVFQIESRAQMSMLPRLKPRNFYDLVIEVAIVRPGPIQGKMVHPYLRRRTGEEKVSYPNPEIESVLGRTLGVPLFQEQAMQLAIVAGGFTPDEADKLRRAMASWKRKGDLIYRFGQKLVAGMIERGYPADFAERCFEQIKGFSEYGFPESHAASFAILVYVSCWLKCHEPAAFAAALINSQPMGFYRPAQIVRDAREHGVRVLGVDVNRSGWDCSLEHDVESSGPTGPRGAPPALRLGMRLVKSLPEEDARKIERAVAQRGEPFREVGELWRASGASVRAMRCLARADAFGSMGVDRQAALWAVRTLRDESLPLFDRAGSIDGTEGSGSLPPLDEPGRTLHDYAYTGLSLRRHPISFLRSRLERRGVTAAGDLRDEARWPHGRRVRVAGVVLVRQRPSTASGVVFLTLEDETGIANLVIWSDTFERHRRAIRLSGALLAEGRVERQGDVVHVHARRFKNLDPWLPGFEPGSRDFH